MDAETEVSKRENEIDSETILKTVMDAETEVSKLNFKIQDSAFLTFHF